MDKYEVIKFKQNGVELDIKISPSENTIWLSLSELSVLLERAKSVISRHIRNIFDEGELREEETVAKKATVQVEGGKKVTRQITYYSLDIAILIGYRIKSQNGLLLKEFVTEYLSNYYRTNDSNIIIYNNGNITLPVTISPNEETVWLNKEGLVLLFDTTRQNVEYHIENIYSQNELEEGATCKEILQVQLEGDREVTRTINIYNLDLIISLGYRINTKNGILFRKWATKVLKEYLLKGYVIDKNRTLVTNENYVNLINKVENVLEKKIDELDTRLSRIEELGVIEKEKIYCDGNYFDARLFIKDLFMRANKSIVLIDPYSDIKTLGYLVDRKNGVVITLCCSSHSKLSKGDIESFEKQYGSIKMVSNDTFHDRFIIIDNKELYHLGASLNYIGRKTFAITKMEGGSFIDLLIGKIE